ncbi:hypothetical protein B0H17DRAFT_394635 [Mycena rosella]|uniref:F-box domain-containing protein n=1 Tax=Mycena rosella TaxID=1033263 RepID=A0AAD7CMR3_MYCRO|nr:hypothetical protein B0H17DRAFT_394635 [Mycena rosella]
MPSSHPSDYLALLSVCETTQDPPGPCPILAIPTEITAQIFTHCLPDSISPPDFDKAPLLLGRICSDWRAIAQDSPELWTSLKIARPDILVELIETWLSRAGNLPLSLILEVSFFEEEWDSAPYIDVLKVYSQTWRDVRLELPSEQSLAKFGLDLHLPMLECLAIDLLESPEDPVNVFRSAHALRHLILEEVIHPTAMSLPWVQLTCFESNTGALKAEDFMTILQYTPNITKLGITIYNDTEVDRLPDVPPLMSLTSLSLCSSLLGSMDILEHLSLPALQILDLSSILFSGRELIPPLHRFLSQPGRRLRELAMRIDGDKPLEEDFILLLETQPTLQKFNLCEGSLDLLIAICHRLNDGSPFLPRLTNLAASPHIYPVEQITSTFPVMLDVLVDALSTRWAAPPELCAQIRTCTLSWSGVRTDDLDNIVGAFRPRQEELTALGITMSVGS